MSEGMARKTLVYCPTSIEIREEKIKFVTRLSTLKGKRVGLLWNGKPNGAVYLNRIAELLAEKFPEVKITKFWELDPGRTAHPEQKTAEVLDFIASESDFVIASTAD